MFQRTCLNRPAHKPQDMPTELSLSDSLLVQTLVKLHPFYYLRLNNFFLLQVSSGRVGVGMSVHSLSSLVLRMNYMKQDLLNAGSPFFFHFETEWVDVENSSYNLEFSCSTFFQYCSQELFLPFNQSHAFFLSGYLLYHYSTLCNLF